jgi:hypothetical protein
MRRINIVPVGGNFMRKTGKKRLVQTLVAAAALVVATQSQGEASEFTGRIGFLRMNPGSSPARLSIFVGPHGSPCFGGDWFAFENADQGLGSVWASALTAALVNRRPIFIVGNNVCDQFNIEEVFSIDVR